MGSHDFKEYKQTHAVLSFSITEGNQTQVIKGRLRWRHATTDTKQSFHLKPIRRPNENRLLHANHVQDYSLLIVHNIHRSNLAFLVKMLSVTVSTCRALTVVHICSGGQWNAPSPQMMLHASNGDPTGNHKGFTKARPKSHKAQSMCNKLCYIVEREEKTASLI